VRALLQRLDIHFEAPVITVAGTNGKGSTCAMLEAIALQAGYRVGLYTKPHLVHFEERCRLNGSPIAAQALLPHFEAVEAARQQAGGPAISWFAFTTLVILRALSQQPLDLVILEVGLGGRLDPVNLVDPDCSVITSIDLDHMELLGPDRESIGREKAHIMRAGRPAVVRDPVPPRSVVEFGEALGAEGGSNGVNALDRASRVVGRVVHGVVTRHRRPPPRRPRLIFAGSSCSNRVPFTSSCCSSSGSSRTSSPSTGCIAMNIAKAALSCSRTKMSTARAPRVTRWPTPSPRCCS
jgi:hypothetical protein